VRGRSLSLCFYPSSAAEAQDARAAKMKALDAATPDLKDVGANQYGPDAKKKT
jgi:hypothetical protein